MQKVSTFNAACFVLAAVLFSYSILSEAPEKLASSSSSMLADALVSISASVAPNPDNTVAAELQKKQDELDVRQKNIDILEKRATTVNAYALYSFLISIALFILVAFNYFFDWRRARFGRIQAA